MDTTQTAPSFYDPHAAVRRLADGAGLSEAQAAALLLEQVHLFERGLATEPQIDELQIEPSEIRRKLRAGRTRFLDEAKDGLRSAKSQAELKAVIKKGKRLEIVLGVMLAGVYLCSAYLIFIAVS